MQVEIIQYCLPDGRQVAGSIEISDECAEKYKEILECGGRLTCEMLRTGEVSQTIEIPDADDVDFDLTLTPETTDQAVHQKALEEMIMRFDKEACRKWITEQT